MRFDRLIPTGLALVVGIAAATGSGCANTPPDTVQADTIETSPAGTITPEPDPVLALLEYARGLNDATPEARAEAVGNARTRASEAPGAMSYARLALAFGTPGQRRYTPDEAARYAQRALDASDARWSPAARQYLSDIARLYTELTDQPQPAGDSTIARRDPRPAQVQPDQATAKDTDEAERVRALEEELDEAHRKLRELADIEDRLSESGS